MKCLTLSRIIALQSDLFSKSEAAKIAKHLKICNRCQHKVKEYENTQNLLRQVSPLTDEKDQAGALDDIQMLSFLGEGHSKKMRQQLYQKLVKSPEILDRMISIESLLHDLQSNGSPDVIKKTNSTRDSFIERLHIALMEFMHALNSFFRTPRPVFRLVGIVLILMTFLIVLDHQKYLSRLPFSTRESAINAQTSTIQLLTPSNRSSVEQNRLQFNWTPVSDIASYNFILLSENGDIIWETNTVVTQLTLPDDIRLRPAETYFWQVECLYELGGSTLSEMASFSFK